MATNHPTFAGYFFVQGVGSNGIKNSSLPYEYQGGIFQGVHSHPISTGLSDIDRRVIYSPHVFGPDYAEEAYFRASNFPMNMPQIWNEHFGFVAAKTGIDLQ
jgi:endoglucanase